MKKAKEKNIYLTVGERAVLYNLLSVGINEAKNKKVCFSYTAVQKDARIAMLNELQLKIA